MSTVRIPDAAERDLLESYIALTIIAGGHELRLFTNDVETGLTPDQIDQLETADFAEATFPGYAAITITSGWTYTEGNPTVAANTLRSFTRSSTGTVQDVYGYFVTLTDDRLQWFEQFDAPIPVEFSGDELRVRPRLTADDAGGTVIPVGMIAPYGAAAAPVGWLLCDGSAVSRTDYADLFAVLGTTYGVGDGSTTFNLPDLRQRVPLGKAASGTGSTLGGTGGSIDHTHSLDTSTAVARLDSQASGTISPKYQRRAGVTGWTSNVQHSSGTGGTAAASADAGITNGVALQGNTDADNPPFLAVNYIVKA